MFLPYPVVECRFVPRQSLVRSTTMSSGSIELLPLMHCHGLLWLIVCALWKFRSGYNLSKSLSLIKWLIKRSINWQGNFFCFFMEKHTAEEMYLKFLAGFSSLEKQNLGARNFRELNLHPQKPMLRNPGTSVWRGATARKSKHLCNRHFLFKIWT